NEHRRTDELIYVRSERRAVHRRSSAERRPDTTRWVARDAQTGSRIARDRQRFAPRNGGDPAYAAGYPVPRLRRPALPPHLAEGVDKDPYGGSVRPGRDRSVPRP